MIDQSVVKFSIIPEYGDISDPEVRAKYGYLQAGVGITLNSLLFSIKLMLGTMIGSIALMTDAFNQFADIGTSIVIFFGFRISKKAPDEKHPFGYGRIEYILAVFIGIMILIVGLRFAYESFIELFNPVIKGNLFVVIVMLILSVVKEGMARFSFSIGKKIDSQPLIADGWNHRFDALTSTAVAFAIFLTTFGPKFRLLDPIFGLIVAAVIVYVGISLCRSSSEYLIGKAPSKELLERIKKTAGAVNGVQDVNKISVHDYGARKAVSLHIEVERGISADDAHTIADKVENAITADINAEPTVHVDLSECDIDKLEIKKIVEALVGSREDVVSYHDLTVTSNGESSIIDVHLIVDGRMSVEESHKLIHDVNVAVKTKLPECKIRAHIEPCIRNCSICNEACSKKLYQ